MNDDQVTKPTNDQSTTEAIDLRAELRNNLADEFKTGLSSCTALTDSQRTALSDSVNEGSLTTASILQTLSDVED